MDIQQLKTKIRDAFGKHPVACDGILIVRVEDYNSLIAFLNSEEEKEIKSKENDHG